MKTRWITLAVVLGSLTLLVAAHEPAPAVASGPSAAAKAESKAAARKARRSARRQARRQLTEHPGLGACSMTMGPGLSSVTVPFFMPKSAEDEQP